MQDVVCTLEKHAKKGKLAGEEHKGRKRDRLGTARAEKKMHHKPH